MIASTLSTESVQHSTCTCPASRSIGTRSEKTAGRFHDFLESGADAAQDAESSNSTLVPHDARLPEQPPVTAATDDDQNAVEDAVVVTTASDSDDPLCPLALAALGDEVGSSTQIHSDETNVPKPFARVDAEQGSRALPKHMKHVSKRSGLAGDALDPALSAAHANSVQEMVANPLCIRPEDASRLATPPLQAANKPVVTSQLSAKIAAGSNATAHVSNRAVVEPQNDPGIAGVSAPDASGLVADTGADHEGATKSDHDVPLAAAKMPLVEAEQARGIQIPSVEFHPSLLRGGEVDEHSDAEEPNAVAKSLAPVSVAEPPLKRLEVQWTDSSLGTISLVAEMRDGELHASVNNAHAGSTLNSHEIHQFLHESRIDLQGLHVNGVVALGNITGDAGMHDHMLDQGSSSRQAGQSFSQRGQPHGNSHGNERGSARGQKAVDKPKVYPGWRQPQIDRRLSIHI